VNQEVQDAGELQAVQWEGVVQNRQVHNMSPWWVRSSC